MTPDPQDLDHPTTTGAPKAPSVVRPEPELGLLAKLIAVPLAPFVALWDGGRALVTRAIPAGAKAVGMLLSAGRRRVARAIRRLGSLLLVPFRALVGAGRGVAATVGSWGRSLGRGVLAFALRVASAARRMWSSLTRPLLAVARRLGQLGRAIGRRVAALARRVLVAGRGGARASAVAMRGVLRRFAVAARGTARAIGRAARGAWRRVIVPVRQGGRFLLGLIRRFGCGFAAVVRSITRPVSRIACGVGSYGSRVVTFGCVRVAALGSLARRGGRCDPRPRPECWRPAQDAGCGCRSSCPSGVDAAGWPPRARCPLVVPSRSADRPGPCRGRPSSCEARSSRRWGDCSWPCLRISRRRRRRSPSRPLHRHRRSSSPRWWPAAGGRGWGVRRPSQTCHHCRSTSGGKTESGRWPSGQERGVSRGRGSESNGVAGARLAQTGDRRRQACTTGVVEARQERTRFRPATRRTNATRASSCRWTLQPPGPRRPRRCRRVGRSGRLIDRSRRPWSRIGLSNCRNRPTSENGRGAIFLCSQPCAGDRT